MYVDNSETPPAAGMPGAPAGNGARGPFDGEPAPARRHLGAVGVVPWGFGRTLAGAAITLIPWFAFIGVSQVMQQHQNTVTHRLPLGVDLANGIVTLLFTAIVEGAFLLAPAYYAVVRRQPGISRSDALAALGLRRAPIIRSTVAVVVSLAVIFAVSVAYGVLIQAFHIPLQTNADVLQQEALYEPITTIALLLGAVFVAPLCEEIFFRGFLFGGLVQRLNVWLAGFLSALLFALAHGDLGSFAVLFVIGCVLAVVRWRAGSLWPGVVIHAANNAVAAVTIIAVIVR